VPNIRLKDDRINFETRLLSGIIVPFLVAAFAILYFLPNETARLFAWPIAPPMTSFLLGSAYIGGAYFFVRVVWLSRWHEAAIGFIPVTTFAALMMLATLLHWDRFSHGNVAFWTWTAIYATTPFLVLAAWLRNRGADPGVPEDRDAELPPAVRVALGAMGGAVLATGIGLFVAPEVLVTYWPWHLTPLTARVVGTCFVLTGVFGASIVRDARWSAARLALQSQAIGVVLILLGSLRGWSSFDHANPLSWALVGGLATMLTAIVTLYVSMERRVRPTRPTAEVAQ
jgi:hypothetical protein